MGAPDQFESDGLGDSYRPRAGDLEVNTVPMPEPPASVDPRDPRALLATLMERSHSQGYETQQIKATLETIRASVGRLASAGNSLQGTDSELARRIGLLERLTKECQDHIMALEKWKENVAGRTAIIASMGGVVMLVVTLIASHVHFA
jgi:hypothetical protein